MCALASSKRVLMAPTPQTYTLYDTVEQDGSVYNTSTMMVVP
jgi:hypothetical protein